MSDNSTFTFQRAEIAHFLKRDIFPRQGRLMRAWRALASNNTPETPSTCIITEREDGFQEQATLTSKGGTYTLDISAHFPSDQQRHTLLSATFKRHSIFNNTVDVTFDLSGMGVNPPTDKTQAERTLREFGTILGYIPDQLKFRTIHNELTTEWAKLEPMEVDLPQPLRDIIYNNTPNCV